MSVHSLHGNPPIDVSVRRSARARKLSLRVSRLDGKVTLTVPQRSPLREGIHFLETRELWLRTHLIRLAPEAVVAAGGTVPYRGAELPGPRTVLHKMHFSSSIFRSFVPSVSW